MYACSIWSNASVKGRLYTKRTLKTLRSLQARAARAICGAYKATSNAALDVEAYLLPIEQQIWRHNADTVTRLLSSTDIAAASGFQTSTMQLTASNKARIRHTSSWQRVHRDMVERRNQGFERQEQIPSFLTPPWRRGPTTYTDATVFSTLSSTAGLWTENPTTKPVWYPIIVENILATLVSNGIGRVNLGKTLAGTLVGLNSPSNPWSLGKWVHEILPKDGKLGYGGHAFNISKPDAEDATKFVLKVNILGYAYSPEGATQIAAMVALSLYVLLVICHISYSVVTGYYSSSWGSPSELTALAMNSDPTNRLKNTGGGIETIDVFKEPVWVRLKDGRAQMVFEDTCIATTKLELGKAYA